jgi:TPR repeat protein
MIIRCEAAVSNIHVLNTPHWRAEALMAMAQGDLGPALASEEAAEWLEAATGCGDVDAQLRLGRMLLTGQGLPVDRRAAFACFLTAAASGNAEAQNLVGRCYENGWGVAVDRGAARLCYREAAELGDYRGAHNHACVLAAEGCLAGALHWFARGIGDAPEPARSQMLESLIQHPRCAIRAFARRELESAPAGRPVVPGE